MTVTTIQAPAETQRRTRGHRFYPPKADLRRIPALYATEGVPLAAKTLHQHYFTGGFDWYVAEVDVATGECFGYVKAGGMGEWGYFNLAEMEAIRPNGTYAPTGRTEGLVGVGTLRWVVERDLYWSPCSLAAL